MTPLNINRRRFLAGTAAVTGGLVLGVSTTQPVRAMPNARPGSFQANAWLQITPQDEVIFQLDKVEMGQGVLTALPTILAEELEIDPRRIVVELAPVNKAFQDPIQITGGSTSVNVRAGTFCARPARRRARCSLRPRPLVGASNPINARPTTARCCASARPTRSRTANSPTTRRSCRCRKNPR